MAEEEPNHSLRSLLKRCRSSPDLVLAARRLGYRITRIKRLQSNESQLDVWRPKWMPTIEMKQTGSEVRLPIANNQRAGTLVFTNRRWTPQRYFLKRG